MKENGDRLIDGEQDDSQWGEYGGGEIEQKGKRTHGHGQQGDDYWVEGNVRGLMGNGKIQ